jgi:hypothetical protein
MTFLLDDGNDIIHLFVFHTDEKRRISGTEEAARGSELGCGEAIFGERLGYSRAVIAVDNCENKFHNNQPFLSGLVV